MIQFTLISSGKGNIHMIAETQTWRAALYLRISKEDGDNKESESITNQRELLSAYVNKRTNITIVATKIDDGWSGANFQRPAFIEMMDEIREGKIDCVIVKDLSRFGRNFGEAGKYIEHIFPFLGVRFVSVNDGIDSANKKTRNDDILIPFLNLISDAYCRDISIKIRSQLDIKRKKGDFVSAFTVFGYKRDKTNRSRLAVDIPAANIVKQIFQWNLNGQSPQKIATRLNSSKVLSPMAYKKSMGLNYSTTFAASSFTKWSATAVLRILKDETYIGHLVQGKVATPNHKIKKKFVKSIEDWARVEDTHEPIISADDFNLVGKLLAQDTRTPPGSEAVYPFSGMAKCGICSENMIRKTSNVGGKAYVYLVCCFSCKGSRVAESGLIEIVKSMLLSHIKCIDITELTRRMVVSFIDIIIVYPDKRLEVLLHQSTAK